MTDKEYENSISNTINNILKRLEEIKNNEMSVIEKIYSYNDFNKMFGCTVEENNYNDMISNYTLNKVELERKISDIIKIVGNYKNDIIVNWDGFNNNYKNHLSIKLNNLFSQLNKNNAYLFGTDNPQLFLNEYLKFYNNIMSINTEKDLLELFAFSDKNYVIFGKNGSGKTRLLKYAKSNYFKTNSFVIPSDREIRFGKLNNIRMDYSQTYTLENLFTNTLIFPNDILTLKIKDKDFEDLRFGKSTTNNNDEVIGDTYNKLKEIFDSLSLDRKITLDIKSNKFMLYNDELNINPYYIEDGSDGEKSIVLFIAYILLCPQNSFVFIDEPESHFNTALLNELFIQLENTRKDIIFIYCTHNIDFIELRNNVKLIYLENYDGSNWCTKEIDSFEDISMEEFINIVGTKKPILFIESEKDKLDYKFYSNLFINYKIIPVSSCDRVINNCKLLNNKNSLNFNRKSFGIIDNDFRSKEEAKKYLRDNIFILDYSEIENMLLSSTILNYICNKYTLQDKIDSFKNSVIDLAIQSKNGIIQDYINKVFYRMQNKEHLQYDGNIKELNNKIIEMYQDNTTHFLAILDNFIKRLEKALEDRDYDTIIKFYPNKGFLSCLSTLEIQYKRYLFWVDDSLINDENFREIIKKELFNNYFE